MRNVKINDLVEALESAKTSIELNYRLEYKSQTIKVGSGHLIKNLMFKIDNKIVNLHIDAKIVWLGCITNAKFDFDPDLNYFWQYLSKFDLDFEVTDDNGKLMDKCSLFKTISKMENVKLTEKELHNATKNLKMDEIKMEIELYERQLEESWAYIGRTLSLGQL
ncbi:MAG: hypothetical protein JSW17_01665 [Candidatus Omnitrophota bacterium]|nr:MAG: hypothetical protein JSW17_01665 [Candidatus Omnitrophota bacterium]